MQVNKSLWNVNFGYVQQLSANINSFTVLADNAEDAMEKAKAMAKSVHGKDEAKDMAIAGVKLLGTED